MQPYYPASRDPDADAIFRAPPPEYRGVPFWSWNGRLEPDQLIAQMADQAAMGMGGYQPHSRIGLETPYLGAEWFDRIRLVVRQAASEGRRVWIYDEDRWPSGCAGGLATRDPATRAQFLRFTRNLDPPPQAALERMWAWIRRDPAGRLLAAYAVRADAAGRILSCRRVAAAADAAPGETVWYAFRERSSPSVGFHGTAYLDTLSPEAVRGFVAITHERYAAELGDALGGTAAAFFTDEPSVTPLRRLASATAPPDPGSCDGDGIVAWTGDLPESYRAAHGGDALDRIPELFLDRADGGHAEFRWRFHDHLSERFRQAFHRTVGDWCERHGVASSGHLLAEDTLYDQHRFLGEAMRHYRHYHIPGIDNLCDLYQPLTAKQAQSVARQDGRPGVMSELYGVTDWPFPAAGHKRQGDWQAALGVTVRVHHLAWYTMAGHAKRDFPAAIDRRLPWWREYPLIEDHFARVGALMTRGEPVCRVAVVHPIESMWTLAGPADVSRAAQGDLEAAWSQVMLGLLHGLIDADFVAESILPEQMPMPAGRIDRFRVGRMAYQAVVLPALRTIRSTTLDRLEAFAAAGGRIIAVGGPPALVDGRPSPRAAGLPALSIPLGRAGLLAALEDLRDIAIATDDGSGVDDCLYQLRREGDLLHLFICATRPVQGGAQPFPWERRPDGCTIRVRGAWTALANDTATGERVPAPHRHADGWTEIAWTPRAAGSLCLTLRPAAAVRAAPLPAPERWRRWAGIGDPAVSPEEPNPLVLSLAEARLVGGDWLPRQEIGLAEDALRAQAGLPPRNGERMQPYALPPSAPLHRAELRFAIACDAPVRGARLACEGAPAVRLDGRPWAAPADGWWIDPCLATMPLPELGAGRHELILELPLGDASTLEWAYILGDFAVQAHGSRARIGAPAMPVGWGDAGPQGLPFYGGNLVYRCRFAAPGGRLRLAVPWFAAPLLAVDLDGRRIGRIAYEPFRLDLGEVSAGEHELAITAFGHRRNHLGALHCRQPGLRWWGPDAYARTDDHGVQEWQLVPTGILAAPFLEVPA